MCVVLVIAETLVGEPLVKMYAKEIPALAKWSSTLSMVTYSLTDFVIVYLMDKFVIMNNNLFVSKEKIKNDEVVTL